MRARSRRARAPSRSSKAWRCRSRRSTTMSCAREIVGRVEAIAEQDSGLFEVRIALAAETVGDDAGQLVNMLFGNSSLHEDVVLHDVELPAELVRRIRRARATACMSCAGGSARRARALTCSALKPQGLPPARLADAGPPLCAGRHRLHQGRPRARRPGLFAVRRAPRGGGRGAAVGVGAGGARALCAEPVRRSRRHAPADRRRQAMPASIPS